MSKKRLLFLTVAALVLSLTLAVTSFAYSVDLYGAVSGLEDGVDYTVARYNLASNVWGTESTLDSNTRLGAGIWKITDSNGNTEELFIPSSQSGQVTFWDSEASAVTAGCLAGKSDSFIPGKWTINKDGAFKNMSASAMKSDTIPTVCVHLDKTKVLKPVEGSSDYINATPIEGEGNLLQESTLTYAFSAEQIIPASAFNSFTFPAVVVRTGAFIYNEGFSLADAMGEVIFSVKVPGNEGYETYTVDVNVDESKTLVVSAPEEMKASKGYLVAITYAPYANCDDKIYMNNNWDKSSTCYVHIGFTKGEVKLDFEESSFPAPVAYDGFGIIGVDPDRTYEISEVTINGKGNGFEFGEWKEYTYSASRKRDLAGLYAVREVYNGKASNHTFAYAYGDNTERQNIIDLNEAGTHVMNCAYLATYDRELFYPGMWSGGVTNSSALGKYTLFSHGHVSLNDYSKAKAEYDAAAESEKEAAKAKLDKEAALLSKNVNNIKYKYAFDEEGIIPVNEPISFKFNLRHDNSTLITDELNTKFVAYVADRNGKITTYETTVTQPYAKSYTGTVNFADFLPDEGWMVAFEIYPNTNTTPDSFVEVGTGAFRYPLTLSENVYTIGTPKELPSSDEKPEGLIWEDGAITGLEKSKAYEWAQFDINGISETSWNQISDVTEFTPDASGLIAVKYGSDGYSHNGSKHAFVYIPGRKMYSIINTVPKLKSDGVTTLEVVDVVDAGVYNPSNIQVKFNTGKWTGYRLTNNLALTYGYDRLILGCSGTPISVDWATALKNATSDADIAKAREDAAKVSGAIYFSYAYRPDEIVAMKDFESFSFKVSIRQTGFALNGSVQTKFVMKVIDDNGNLVDRVVYKDVDYSRTATSITITPADFTDLSGYIVGMVIYPYGNLTEGSYYTYSSDTNGDYIVYLYENSYRVNAISSSEKPKLSVTTKNAIVKIDNYNELLSYAYSDGGEWVKFEGDSFSPTSASTEYRVKALGNSFFLESEESDPITSPAITVVGSSLVLDGSIGIKLYMDIDTDVIKAVNLHTTKINYDFKDYADNLSYGEGYRIGGAIDYKNSPAWGTPITKDQESGLYYTVFHIPAKDLDNTKIECDLGGYVDGVRVSFSNVGGGISFDTYVAKAKALAASGDAEFIKALDLIEALEVYAKYADNYFNNGSCEAFTTKNALNPSTSSKIGALDGAEFHATSLLLEDKITIRHYFRVDDLEEYNKNYTCTIPYGEKNGLIYYDIKDIPAQEIGELQTLTIKNSEGTAFEIKYSVANYIASALSESDARLVSLMNTMIDYYNAAYSYANPKPLYVRYDSSSQQEHTVESIHLYIPTKIGYIDQVFGHTVNKNFNADIWRLSLAYMVDDNLENPVQITTVGEWDMALKIVGRPDFVGGQAHGDEITTDIKFIIDGVETDVTTLTTATEFKNMVIVQDSKGYDPLDNVTHVLNHHKEHNVSLAGIRLDQRVEWLGDFDVAHSYLAMMPPSKKYTDMYYTNLTEPAEVDLTTGTKYVNGATSATVYGRESGLYFTMTVNDYNTFMKPELSIADNGGGAYNKMYFTYVKSGKVFKGDVWETFTHYKIDRK